MKSIVSTLAIALFVLSPLTFVRAQGSPAPAKTEKAVTPSATTARTDVYHVHFAKAALGKAGQLGDWFKTPDPKAPMPGHFVVLRHQEGDSWDYAVITHLGTKATV